MLCIMSLLNLESKRNANTKCFQVNFCRNFLVENWYIVILGNAIAHNLFHKYHTFIAGKCSTKNHFVSLWVCLSVLSRPFCPLLKIFRKPIPENLRLYPTFFCGCSYEKKRFKKIGFPPSNSTFWTPSTKQLFAQIKKIFLHTLAEMIFRYH